MMMVMMMKAWPEVMMMMVMVMEERPQEMVVVMVMMIVSRQLDFRRVGFALDEDGVGCLQLFDGVRDGSEQLGEGSRR